jgi:hypothetical protein
LFFIHGHQGDWKSDKLAWLSKPIVRYLWRPIQRRFNISLNTPAQEWNLREWYNIAMARWAEKQSRLVLIAGHTHQPVFLSKSHEIRTEAVDRSQIRSERLTVPPASQMVEALEAAKKEWEKWEKMEEERRKAKTPPSSMKKICYFNTGCGCYFDGTITGLEIINGNIQLIRWQKYVDEPEPRVQVIAGPVSLCEVLRAC